MTDLQAKAVSIQRLKDRDLGRVDFCITPPQGIPQFLWCQMFHRSILWGLDQIAMAHFKRAKKYNPRAPRLVAGTAMAAVILTLPDFVHDPIAGGTAGTLDGRKVYFDFDMPNDMGFLMTDDFCVEIHLIEAGTA